MGTQDDILAALRQGKKAGGRAETRDEGEYHWYPTPGPIVGQKNGKPVRARRVQYGTLYGIKRTDLTKEQAKAQGVNRWFSDVCRYNTFGDEHCLHCKYVDKGLASSTGLIVDAARRISVANLDEFRDSDIRGWMFFSVLDVLNPTVLVPQQAKFFYDMFERRIAPLVRDWQERGGGELFTWGSGTVIGFRSVRSEDQKTRLWGLQDNEDGTPSQDFDLLDERYGKGIKTVLQTIGAKTTFEKIDKLLKDPIEYVKAECKSDDEIHEALGRAFGSLKKTAVKTGAIAGKPAAAKPAAKPAAKAPPVKTRAAPPPSEEVEEEAPAEDEDNPDEIVYADDEVGEVEDAPAEDVEAEGEVEGEEVVDEDTGEGEVESEVGEDYVEEGSVEEDAPAEDEAEPASDEEPEVADEGEAEGEPESTDADDLDAELDAAIEANSRSTAKPEPAKKAAPKAAPAPAAKAPATKTAPAKTAPAAKPAGAPATKPAAGKPGSGQTVVRKTAPKK